MSYDKHAVPGPAGDTAGDQARTSHPAARGTRSSWFVECADRVMLSIDGGPGRYRILADGPDGPIGVWVVHSLSMEIDEVPLLTDVDGAVAHPFGTVVNVLRFNN